MSLSTDQKPNLMLIEKDPFRLFFPLGSLFALMGVLPWIFNLFGFPDYPSEFHRAIMMNSFMLSFVMGFLMTAIPRFTSTHYAKLHEVIVAATALIAAAIFELLGLREYHHLTAAAAIFALMLFAFIRFQKRKMNPPFTFIFVGIGLVLWLLTNLLHFWIILTEGVRPSSISIWGNLLSNGALMSIVLGIGGRLIPGILGWQEIVTIQRGRYEQPVSFLSAIPPLIWTLLLVHLATLFLQTILPLPVVLLLRAGVVGSFAFIYWRLHKLPREKSYLTWGIWISCWCFVIGSFLNVIQPSLFVHILHLILVGGFSLLTILVATRVTLAHGSKGTAAEKTSWFIPVFTLLILIATVTRVTAPLWPSAYLNHLSYAAITWSCGFILWIIFSIPKMWKS